MRNYGTVCGLGLILAVPSWSQDPAPPADHNLSSLTLEQLMDLRVEGAAMHPQSLEDAPASVTIITAADIRKYGYRTLGEALTSARGFYLNNDRSYRSVGVRGFNLPGDYASRFLVMVNGHNMADNIFDSMLWFGVDFPIDLTLVKRIEVIRGPSSALYGSNGIFATINIITKTAEEAGPPAVIADFGSFGEKRIQMMAAEQIGKSASVLLSGSVFNNSGESPLYFREFDTPETGNGQAVRMDGEKGYHFFANLIWRRWSVTGAISDRNKIQPISWGPTVFNDRGTHLIENANYVEAAYTRELAKGTLRWRTSYNSDHLGARFDYPLGATVEDNRTFSWGDWIESQLTYRFDVPRLGTLTTGVEGKLDLRTYQGSADVSPAAIQFVNIDRRDKSIALFGQDELSLSPRWKLDLGVRIDVSAYRRNFVSPRAALIYQPSSVWTYKFLYGRGFRNPTAFQLFYDDGLSSVANPRARPEKVDTAEIDVERKIGHRMTVAAAAYRYWLRDFLVGVFTDSGLIQTQNLGKVHAAGFAVELNGHPASWFETTASYAIQRTTDPDEDNRLENSPEHMAKLRFAVPFKRKFDFSSGMQYFSSRRTLAGATLGAVYLADFTITSRQLLPALDIQFGIRNAFNRNYSDPIALNQAVDAMRQPGRSVFVRLIAHGPR